MIWKVHIDDKSHIWVCQMVSLQSVSPPPAIVGWMKKAYVERDAIPIRWLVPTCALHSYWWSILQLRRMHFWVMVFITYLTASAKAVHGGSDHDWWYDQQIVLKNDMLINGESFQWWENALMRRNGMTSSANDLEQSHIRQWWVIALVYKVRSQIKPHDVIKKSFLGVRQSP